MKKRKFVRDEIRTELQGSYPKGECPDCKSKIPKMSEDGDACQNCGHIFYSTDGK